MEIICLEPVVADELWTKDQQTYCSVATVSQIPVSVFESLAGQTFAPMVPVILASLFSKAYHAYQVIFPSLTLGAS